MNERIRELAEQACIKLTPMIIAGIEYKYEEVDMDGSEYLTKFAQLIVQECIDKIETYRIPLGNSFSGELACEWTYAALKEIRDDIKETFGIK